MNVQQIDELLGLPARLAICLSLADGQSLTFTELKQVTGLADGNLHVQCGKLVEGGYLSREKVSSGGRRVTCFTLLPLGRQRLRELAGLIGAALRASRTAAPSGATGRGRDDSMVW